MKTITDSFVSKKFFNLIEFTNPHGSEKELLPHLPPLSEDPYGNYFCVIGDKSPATMFTAHLDNYCNEQMKVNFQIMDIDGEIFVKTDGKTILGADDKAGISILCYMIENHIPGLYYFFIGEEVGCIGSTALRNNVRENLILNGIQNCISFDRKGKKSIITEMGREISCSSQFAYKLQKEFAKTGLIMEPDPTGVWTDSGEFIGLIPNCTNLSVGYEKAHTSGELQNLSFLNQLAESCLVLDWS